MTITTSTGPPTRRWAGLLLAALAAVLAFVMPAGTASASGPPAAQTRVGAITPAVTTVVGVHECITAGQRPVWGPSQLRLALGHCVASEEVPRVVNLGGEGEIAGAINQQIPAALNAGWGASRSAVAGKSLAELRAMGDSYVVAENTALPFANGSIDRVVTNSVPIDVNTVMGPGVQSSEIWRILKSGGDWLHNGQVMP